MTAKETGKINGSANVKHTWTTTPQKRDENVKSGILWVVDLQDLPEKSSGEFFFVLSVFLNFFCNLYDTFKMFSLRCLELG